MVTCGIVININVFFCKKKIVTINHNIIYKSNFSNLQFFSSFGCFYSFKESVRATFSFHVLS